MPCFKGLAVSIHTPAGPLPEYSIQKQSRQSRIASYIPVPPPKFTPGSSRPEQSTFAISITLLQPGAGVPYSRPAPTVDDPFPSQKIVGGLPNFLGERGKYTSVVSPYIPLTSSPNETVAAYIHFDGRAKEEVATLLRRGVETWVNSRWVSVPDAEGGGLAEREFLFREVGLERWLNGLDLQGESKDVAARLERRRQKLEKKRRKKLLTQDSDDEEEFNASTRARPVENNGVLRYGNDKTSPVEDLSPDDGMLSSDDDDSEDEMPDPEAAGQIKVSLFRVMASGEIKKGEYSPSFDAHDDDEEAMQEPSGDAAGVDHTTTFAKPKTLDPKSISTQTVTGLDDPTRPYATFTFFYRGERQLQKMGILPPTENTEKKAPAVKRKSRQLDLSTLSPLKPKGTVGFAGYRDPTAPSSSFEKAKNGKVKSEDDMDSDGDDQAESTRKQNGTVSKDDTNDVAEDEGKEELSPEEVAKRGELAEGVKKIQLKRQHSFEPPPPPSSATSSTQPSALASSSTPSSSQVFPEPTDTTSTPANTPHPPSSAVFSNIDLSDVISSPFKKQRPSVSAGAPTKLFSSMSNTGIGVNKTSFTPQSSPTAEEDTIAKKVAAEKEAFAGNTKTVDSNLDITVQGVGGSPPTTTAQAHVKEETIEASSGVDVDEEL